MGKDAALGNGNGEEIMDEEWSEEYGGGIKKGRYGMVLSNGTENDWRKEENVDCESLSLHEEKWILRINIWILPVNIYRIVNYTENILDT